MNLSTRYMGLKLRSPLVASASPVSENLDNIKHLEDVGIGAIVFHSLFEEEITLEKHELHHHLTYGTESFAESLTYFPEPVAYKIGPETYLERIQAAKRSVRVPIIASLNGATPGGWTEYARLLESAGADALELNIYSIPTDMTKTSQEVEENYVNILKAVKEEVHIPVALKVSPFFSNFAYMARRFDEAGANALVMFNRFFQPDVNLEELKLESKATLSRYYSEAFRLPLCWIGILYGRIQASLAATSGIHRGEDVLKMIMVGADVTMLCSVLLRKGIDEVKVIEKEIEEWMERNEYVSIEQMKGSMSQQKCEDPSTFERAQYMRALRSYRPEPRLEE